ncbi:MAG: transcriptional repressor [Zetaproteobacteria bacterium]|nr:transcriptional repressor [Pseudobdellovibrionaceae bacterium]|tara:strand:- start:293 stop:664 length:372 start_codon:yes stop_codon:yes gene_type:complete
MQRDTKQRGTILKVLKIADRPLSIEEILVTTRKIIPGIGIATVYRAIKSYLQNKKITKVNLPGCQQRYEVTSLEHNHHFWCRMCDKVFKVPGCSGKLNFNSPEGFQTELHEITLKGLCSECSL